MYAWGVDKDYRKWHELKSYIEEHNSPILLSTQIKENKFYFKYSFDDKETASILLSQLRLLSSKRLIRRLVTINEETFKKIRNEANGLLENESDSTDVESSGG